MTVQVGARHVELEPNRKRAGMTGWLVAACAAPDGFVLGIDVASSPEAVPYTAAELVARGRRGAKGGRLPGRIETTDSAIADHLRSELAGRDVEVEVVERTELLDQFFREMPLREVEAEDLSATPIDFGDVPIERWRAFAEAAAKYHEAAIWNHLSEHDVLHVGNVVLPGDGFDRLQVIGRGGDVQGLATFVPAPRIDEPMRKSGPPLPPGGAVALLFIEQELVRPLHVRIWQDRQLPLSPAGVLPMLRRYLPERRVKVPRASEVTFFEGLCRALAETSEEEIDTGRWRRTVPTFDGTATFELSIPNVLVDPEKPASTRIEPMVDRRAMERTLLAIRNRVRELNISDIEQVNEILKREFIGKRTELPPPKNDRERAQRLIYDAFDARGRRRVQLARKALSIWPDCADAYVLLAEARDFAPEQALDLYREGVEAGRRALGPERFQDPKVEWWSDLETRPFLRALFGLGSIQADLERHDEAIETFRELLRLNRNDNQGGRYRLATELLRANRLDELDEFLNRGPYPDEWAAEWKYTRALLAFRRRDPNARQRLEEAMEANTHVPRFLLDPIKLPDEMPESYTPGEEDEAVCIAEEQGIDWEQTEGALDWLAKVKRESVKRARNSRSRRR